MRLRHRPAWRCGCLLCGHRILVFLIGLKNIGTHLAITQIIIRAGQSFLLGLPALH